MALYAPNRLSEAVSTPVLVIGMIAGPDPEINKLTGEPILPEEKPKPIKLSGDIRAKYFSDTPSSLNPKISQITTTIV